MSKKNIYRVEYRPMRNNFAVNSKKGGIVGEVCIEVKAYDINDAINVANNIIGFDASDPHVISGVNLMFRPCVECDEDGD